MKNPLKEKRKLMGATREEIADRLNTKLYNINDA